MLWGESQVSSMKAGVSVHWISLLLTCGQAADKSCMKTLNKTVQDRYDLDKPLLPQNYSIPQTIHIKD